MTDQDQTPPFFLHLVAPQLADLLELGWPIHVDITLARPVDGYVVQHVTATGHVAHVDGANVTITGPDVRPQEAP